MKAILALYLKAFLLFSIPFFVLTYLFDLLAGEPSVGSPLLKSGFYGLFMAIIFISGHIFSIREKKLGPINAETIKVFQKKSIKSNLSQSSLIEKLLEDPACNKLDIRTSENEILIRTRTTFWSWGEKIKILIHHASDGMNQFMVTSHPEVRFTMVDYGKNIQNVQRIEKLITS